jgi:prepilin-type processing-associated H-X9-DG protein
LLELLVVMAIVGIMAALLLPALQKAREQGRSTACRHNMRQLALGFYMYADENEGYLPWAPTDPDRNWSADFVFGGPDAGLIDSKDASSWAGGGFSYHEESGAVFPYVTGQPREVPHKDANKAISPAYRCPSTGRLGAALRVNFSMNGLLDPTNPKSSPKGIRYTSIHNPSQKVLLLNESPETMYSAGFLPGLDPDRDRLVSHLGRANIAFVDSHVETVNTRTAAEILDPLRVAMWFDPFE